MKKLILKAAVLAVAMAAPSVASAVVTPTVDLDLATGATNYASQLSMTDANPLVGAANALNFNAKIGFGVSAGQTRYIRLEYGNATLDAPHGATLGTHLEDATTAGALDGAGGSVAIVQGGTAGTNYVIYQITPALAVGATDVMDFAVPNLRVTSTGSSVTVNMQLHETAVSAVAGSTGAGLLYSKSGNIATFGSGLNFALTPAANTAAVTTLFQKFCNNPANDCTAANAVTTKPLGTLVYDVTAAKDRTGDGVELGVAADGAKDDLVTTADLIVAGTFTAAAANNDVWIDTNGGGCNSVDKTGTMNAEKTQVVFAVNNAPIAAGAELCYKVNGTTVIPEQTVTAQLDIKTTPADVTTADVAAATAGTIAHDGTTLKAPFTNNKNGQATFVQLANMSSSTNAPYTTRCFDTTGTITVGTPGQVDKGETLTLSKTALGCAGSVNAVEFTLAVPQGTVVGSTVRQNNTTGDSAIDSLTGNQ